MSNLFRKKSLERISSPEQLNDYIRVSTPSVWMLLTAIVVLLTGVCVWGIFGHMDTVVTAVAVRAGDTVTAYVRSDDMEGIEAGKAVSIGSTGGTVAHVSPQPIAVDDTFTDYMRHVGALETGQWVYAVTLDIECAEGVHEVSIVTSSVSPMSFVLN